MNFLNRIWLNIWKGKPPSLTLLFINLSSACILMMPLIYILSRAINSPWEKWSVIFRSRIPTLLWDTISLALTVALFTTVIGVILSWLTEYTDLAFKRYMRLIFTLPLVFPPYIGALTYIIIFGRRGVMYSLTGSSIIDVFSFFSVAFILSMFTFPYTYLTISGSMRRISGNYEEAGRSCGAPYSTIFMRVLLPLVKPAILSSSMIIIFYIMSDFGGVAMLRYTTFTSSIYFQMIGKLDRSGAAILSTLLIVFGFLLLALKAQILKKVSFYQSPKSNRIKNPIKLGKLKALAWIFILFIIFFSLILPLSTLTIWSIKAIHQGAVGIKSLYYIKNSLVVSIGAVLITMTLSLPIAYMKYRHPAKITSVLNNICHLGSIVPGILLALGIVFITNRYLTFMVGSQLILIIGHSMRFIPRNLQSAEASMSLIPPALDETAFSLGKKFSTVLYKVILPTVSPGVLSGGAMVLVSSLKELPMTLMLRPPGYDTLSVRLWLSASDGFYINAAPSGLFIVLASIIPLYYLVKKEKVKENGIS